MSLDHPTQSQLDYWRQARDLRRRLYAPPNAKIDVEIALKHPKGITGWEAERAKYLATIERLEAEKLDAEQAKKEAESKLRSLQYSLVASPVNNVENPNVGDTIPGRVERHPSNFIEYIKYVVAREFDLTVVDLICARRSKEYVIPRHIAIELCRRFTLRSLPEIGRHFGGRDHTTILSSIRRLPTKLTQNPQLAERVETINSMIERDLKRWRAGGELRKVK